MADIVVRSMEMPESCFECVLTHSFFRNLHCDELEGMGSFIDLPHVNDRHPNCPLIPLPERHERLCDTVDAIAQKVYAALDALDRGINNDWARAALEEANQILNAYYKKGVIDNG